MFWRPVAYQILMWADDTYPEKGARAGRTEAQHARPWAHGFASPKR